MDGYAGQGEYFDGRDRRVHAAADAFDEKPEGSGLQLEMVLRRGGLAQHAEKCAAVGNEARIQAVDLRADEGVESLMVTGNSAILASLQAPNAGAPDIAPPISASAAR